VNPDLAAGPRHGEEARGFEFSCTFAPGKVETPASAKRLCAARRGERVSARRSGDGGLRIRIRFRDIRGHRLDLFLYRQGRHFLRGAMLVEGHGSDRVEIEPDRGWIAVDHLDLRARAASGRYALTFGGVRVGGSFAVNMPRQPAEGETPAPLIPPPAPPPPTEPQ